MRLTWLSACWHQESATNCKRNRSRLTQQLRQPERQLRTDDEKKSQWRFKAEHYLFPVTNLAKVFRAKMFDGIKALGLKVKETLPDDWVVHCKQVGRGEQALIYLGRAGVP